MRVQGESVGIGQQTSPRIEAADTVGNREIWSLAFTDASDFARHPVDFQIASNHALNGSDANMKNRDSQ